MLSKLWERYLLKQIFSMVLLLLLCCYLIYSIMDYSLRSKIFTTSEIAYGELFLYYGWQFVTRLEILLPLALMLSTIRVLTTLNVHSELVAFLAGGVRLRRLMRPFILTGLLFALLLTANYQWCYPSAARWIERFEDQYVHHRAANRKSGLNIIGLADRSKLLYQHYDTAKERFFDTFWIRSPDEIYRIKELSPHEAPAHGWCIDRLQRGNEGSFEVTEHHPDLALEELQFNRDDLFAALVPAVNLSLTQLWESRPSSNQALTDRDAQIGTFLHKKLSMPLLALIAIFGPAPFCIRFGRRQPIFLIYGLSLLAFISFLTTMGAMEILGEEHVFSPVVVMWAPLVLCSIPLFWPVCRLLRE